MFDPTSGWRPPQQREALLIGACCGHGGRDRRTRGGPAALLGAGLRRELARSGIATLRVGWLAPRTEIGAPAEVARDLCARLAAVSERATRRGGRLLVLGGDHSCAIGTWSGVARAHAGRERPGLIWIDAHLDSHTPQSSRSGLLHGMPLACLLGRGDPGLSGLAGRLPALDPRRVCLIGARSYEPAEQRLLRMLGVRVIGMGEVRERGLPEAMAEALAIARRPGVGFGVSIDLDALDPREAPGVSVPVAGGLGGDELCRALRALAPLPELIGVEIAEFNPARDRAGRTARVACRLVAAALAGRYRDDRLDRAGERLVRA